MTPEEINAWVLLFTGPTTFLIYVVILLNRQGDIQLVESSYQALLLIAFGAAAGISVITSFVTGRLSLDTNKRDIRDNQIEHASGYISTAPVVIGGLLVLVMGLAEVHHFWIANTMYFSFIVASVFRSITKIVAYRRGFGHW